MRQSKSATYLPPRFSAGKGAAVNGKFVGSTSTTLHPAAGHHVIRLEKSGFTPWECTLTITPGEVTNVAPALEKLGNAQ